MKGTLKGASMKLVSWGKSIPRMRVIMSIVIAMLNSYTRWQGRRHDRQVEGPPWLISLNAAEGAGQEF